MATYEEWIKSLEENKQLKNKISNLIPTSIHRIKGLIIEYLANDVERYCSSCDSTFIGINCVDCCRFDNSNCDDNNINITYNYYTFSDAKQTNLILSAIDERDRLLFLYLNCKAQGLSYDRIRIINGLYYAPIVNSDGNVSQEYKLVKPEIQLDFNAYGRRAVNRIFPKGSQLCLDYNKSENKYKVYESYTIKKLDIKFI